MFGRNYKPLNRIEIHKKNLLSNYRVLSRYGVKIAPVLKSNAYGHGIVEVAKLLDGVGAPFYCVDSLFEGYKLSLANIHTPILIMGYVAPASLKTKKLPFSFALHSLSQLEMLRKYQAHAPVHIFIDTGMHREGFVMDELTQLITVLKIGNVKVEGLMSHFASSENPTLKQTRMQKQQFSYACELFEKRGIPIKYKHIQNSSGILHSDTLKNQANVGRAGIALYGIDPEGKNTKLKPVASLLTQIAQVKIIEKNDEVGYGFTFRSKRRMKIAVLPVGYNDGLDRRLSNRGAVLINNFICPIIGTVSMNITMVDVTDAIGATEGSDAVIYSSKKEEINTIEKSAQIAGTIPYELLVHLHPSTKRVIV